MEEDLRRQSDQLKPRPQTREEMQERYDPGGNRDATSMFKEVGESAETEYGWIPHNAGFGFLDLTPATLGQIHF
jgi:hypothetical protein